MSISIIKIIQKTYKQKSDLYLKILKDLKEKNIEFIIINLPLFYENNKIPNDIDLVLDKTNYDSAKVYLLNNGFIKLDRFINSNQEAFIFYYPDKCEFIRVHLHLNFSFYGLDIISYKDLKKNSILIDDFLYPNSLYENAILLFESFFRKKFHYYDRMYDVDKSFIQLKFNDKRATKLFNILLGFYQKKQKVSTKEQIKIMFSVYKLNILPYLHKKFFILASKFYILKRKGKLVFVLGIDGSGKSTISENVVKKIESGGFLSKYAYWGLKVTLVQKLRQFLKKDKKQSNQKLSHHIKLTNGISDRISKKSKILGNIFYFILSVVYIVDYWILIFKDLIFISNENNYLIVDRTYYDKLFDNEKLSNRLFYYFLPKPDYIFRLDGDLEIFYERKKEFCIEDLKILNKRVDNIVNFCKNKEIKIYEIDTTKNSIDKAVCKIVNFIWENRC